MTKEYTTKPISIRLSASVRKTVKKIPDDTGLGQAALFDMILRAGCKVIAENNYKLSLPLDFQFAEEKKVQRSSR